MPCSLLGGLASHQATTIKRSRASHIARATERKLKYFEPRIAKVLQQFTSQGIEVRLEPRRLLQLEAFLTLGLPSQVWLRFAHEGDLHPAVTAKIVFNPSSACSELLSNGRDVPRHGGRFQSWMGRRCVSWASVLVLRAPH